MPAINSKRTTGVILYDAIVYNYFFVPATILLTIAGFQNKRVCHFEALLCTMINLQNSIGCILICGIATLLALPLGRYLSRVYKEEKTFLDFWGPVEKFIYKLCRINTKAGMNWKQYLSAIFVINSIWLVWGFVILIFQGKLFLNPAIYPVVAGNPVGQHGYIRRVFICNDHYSKRIVLSAGIDAGADLRTSGPIIRTSGPIT
jgi:hypothetical protein